MSLKTKTVPVYALNENNTMELFAVVTMFKGRPPEISPEKLMAETMKDLTKPSNYRLLNEGETIQEGDEYLYVPDFFKRDSKVEWLRTSSLGKVNKPATGLIYRREITSFTP